VIREWEKIPGKLKVARAAVGTQVVTIWQF